MNPIAPKINPSLSLEPTSPRSTPHETSSFREVLGGSAAHLVRGAESALHRLPGGPVLAAAVRGSGATLSTPGASHANLLPPGTGAAEGPSSPEATLAAPGASLEGSLSASQDMNLYFLRIQEAMAAENRAYTACSNVLKARHDTVKNAIGNIR